MRQRRLCNWRCGFLDEEHDIFLATFDHLQSVARHSDKMGNIDQSGSVQRTSR